MALETGTYPKDLVTTNPTAGDPVSQADDHMRLLKVCLKNATAAPAFSAYADVTQSIVATTDTKITFGTEIFDSNGCFAASRFTPTVEGWYQLNGVARCSATSLTIANVAIYKNGASCALGDAHSIPGGTNTRVHCSVSEMVYLNGSTDYVELWASISGTSPSFDFFSSAVTSRFSGFLARLPV